LTASKQEDAPFEIHVDEAAGIVRTVLRGFWTLEDLAAFGRGMFAAVGRVAPRHAVFALMSDSSAFKIQSAEVGEAFAKMMDQGNRAHAGPTAIVVGTTLNKLQAERLFTDPRVRVFIEAADAQAWVNEELAVARRTGGVA
jgi:hypothetical protein